MRRIVRFIIFVVAAASWGTAAGVPQAVTVTGSIAITRETVRTGKISNANAVVWLKANGAAYRRSADAVRPHFKILQQHKRFDPHVLAVPAGSIIDFPNLDPFFHNVFSMFDGKRFDLGLYEAGGSHSVTFESPGVCYIFCNIHPEMSAAIVVVDSPYYTMSNESGSFSIRNVPPGEYLLNVWHERGKPPAPDVYPRIVAINADNANLGTIHLVDNGEILANHKNKYGQDYDHDKSSSPIYK
jgi:plastocyanin